MNRVGVRGCIQVNTGANACATGLFRFRLPLQQTLQDGIRIETLGLGVEIEQNAMAQDGRGQSADILVSDMVAAAHQGSSLGSEHDKLRRSDAGAEINIIL